MVNLDNYNFVRKISNTYIRLLWYLIYFVLVASTIPLLIALHNELYSHPIVTTLQTPNHPVREIPFPGVSICTINSVSKRRMQEFGKTYLENRTDIQYGVVFDAIIEAVGSMADFDYTDNYFYTFDDIEKLLRNINIAPIALIKMVSSNCQDLLDRCEWNGEKLNCSTLFTIRLTYIGFCCTFNYVKQIHNVFEGEIKKQPLKYTDAGLENGLTVHMKSDLDDIAYPLLNTLGVTVQIFTPTDYPDQASGDLYNFIAQYGTRNFIEIVPTVVRSVHDVRHIPLEKRGCFFENEKASIFENMYSQSDCFVDCRSKGYMALCKCVPFTMPDSTTEKVCNFTDLPCLRHYLNKWNFIFPAQLESGYDSTEIYDALPCGEGCYPSCNTITYGTYFERTFLKQRDHTVIHIYFYDYYAELYKQDVTYYWYEWISNFGGIFGITIGFSILSIVEIIFFCIHYLATSVKCLSTN